MDLRSSMIFNSSPSLNLTSQASPNRPDVVLQIDGHRWVIPYNGEILKSLISEQNITAQDLQFGSYRQCQRFIRRLLLLAAADECRHCRPSVIAALARDIILYRAPNIKAASTN